jgi:hypothetical protein
MVALLRERDHRLFISDAHLHRVAARADRQLSIAEAADEIKRLTRRLLAGEAQGVLRDRGLDRFAHRCGGAKKPVRGRESLERLVRALEVVVLHE